MRRRAGTLARSGRLKLEISYSEAFRTLDTLLWLRDNDGDEREVLTEHLEKLDNFPQDGEEAVAARAAFLNKGV